MHKLTIAVATVAFGAFLASAPAMADANHGGPVAKNGQCFKYSPGSESRDYRFGVWGACPQTASTAVAPANRRARRASSR